MLFFYKGINQNNEIKVGYINAYNEKHAIRLLKNNGIEAIYSLESKAEIPGAENIRLKYSKFIEKQENKKAKQREKIRKEGSFKDNLYKQVNIFMDNLKSLRRPETKVIKYQLEDFKNNKAHNEDVGESSTQRKVNRSIDSRTIKKEDTFTVKGGKRVNWSLIESREKYLKNKKTKKLKIKPKEIIMFTKRLRIMLLSGISIPRALEILSDTDHKDMQTMILNILDDVREGEKLSTALSKYPEQFDATYISLVSIGIQSGNLTDVLEDAIEKMEKEEKIRKKIRNASIYPAGVMVVLIGVMLVGSKFIIPQFEEIFTELAEESGVSMPAITVFVFGVANNLPLVLGTTIGGILIFNLLRKIFKFIDKKYIEVRDKLLLKIPKLNSLLMSSYMYTIASNISLMISSGINLNDALSLTKDALSNVYVKNNLVQTSYLMEQEALSFSESLAAQPYIDSLLSSMALTGEESGEMSKTLKDASDYYEQELNAKLEDLIEMIQPVSIILIAILVVPVVFAIFIPILDMQSAISM